MNKCNRSQLKVGRVLRFRVERVVVAAPRGRKQCDQANNDKISHRGIRDTTERSGCKFSCHVVHKSFIGPRKGVAGYLRYMSGRTFTSRYHELYLV